MFPGTDTVLQLQFTFDWCHIVSSSPKYKKQSLYRLGCFQEVEAPKFRDSREMKAVKLTDLLTGYLYFPGIVAVTHFC